MALVSAMVLFIFQLPAIIAFLIVKTPELLFIVKTFDAGKFLPFEKFERSAASGRNVSHFIGKTELGNRRRRISAADDCRSVFTVCHSLRYRYSARCQGRIFENTHRSVPDNRLRPYESVGVKFTGFGSYIGRLHIRIEFADFSHDCFDRRVDRIGEIFDFYSLGLGDPYPVSAVHGIGTGDVLDAIVQNLPNEIEEENEDVIKFSLIGRPNVGKSSLINAILGEDRVIASPVAGTTRDAIDTHFTDADGQEFTMIDTAGMRKSGKIYENTEKYSVMRAMRAIDRSDVVLMVINAEEGIREYDKRIAGFAHEAGKGMIIVVNKWDTIEKDNHTMKQWEDDIRDQFQYLSYAPIVFVSALTKQRLHKLPDMIKQISESQNTRIPSAVLNDVIMDAIAINPTPTDKGKRLKIFYATQVATKPPTFVVFVNEEELMHFSYLRFLENQIRKAFVFEGTPIHLIARKRK